MATIKIGSYAENSMVFYLHDTEHARTFILDGSTKLPTHVIPNAVAKTIVIMGVHPYNENNAFKSPCAFTDIDSADWEAIQKTYAHSHFIKNKIIFAGKNENETLAIARAGEAKEYKTGTKKHAVTAGKAA